MKLHFNISLKLFDLFTNEWDVFVKTCKLQGNYSVTKWIEFIENKDLGVVCIKSSDSPAFDEYEVVDEKKWLLTKIKYGI